MSKFWSETSVWRMKTDKIDISMAELFFYGILGTSKWHSVPRMTLESCVFFSKFASISTSSWKSYLKSNLFLLATVFWIWLWKQGNKSKNFLNGTTLNWKASAQPKKPSRKWEKHPPEWEEIVANHLCEKELYPKYMQKSHNSITKQTNSKIFKNEQGNWTDPFSREDIEVVDR